MFYKKKCDGNGSYFWIQHPRKHKIYQKYDLQLIFSFADLCFQCTFVQEYAIERLESFELKNNMSTTAISGETGVKRKLLDLNHYYYYDGNTSTAFQ